MDIHGQFKYFFGVQFMICYCQSKTCQGQKSHNVQTVGEKHDRTHPNTSKHIRTRPPSQLAWSNTPHFTQLVANMTRTSSGSRGVSGHPVSGDFCGGMHGCQTAQAVNCSTTQDFASSMGTTDSQERYEKLPVGD